MSRRTSSVKSGNVVDQEVAKLMSLQNKTQYTNALLALRQRYKDEDIVRKIEDVFAARHSRIIKSAKKFTEAVKTKYANQNVPFHQLLMKARAHAKKHNLSEEEFAEFQRICEQELAGNNSSEVLIPVTNLMKVLGNVSQGADNYFNVDSNDMRNLQEILALHESTKQLHAQVLLQSLQYSDFDINVKYSKFNQTYHSPTDYVHPVIAALFFPKIKTIDEHFLCSNLSGIVKSRYNRQPLRTKCDYELFYNLVTDPNDVVCDTHSPVADLLNRCNLQTQLWNSVLHLRNAQCFSPSLREFTKAIDMCRLNKFDNPDFVYGRHDGTIIKRLFSAFSFRPTIVTTLPAGQQFSYNPYFQSLRPLVTSIPMINIRMLGTNGATPINFKTLLVDGQKQQFIEGNMLVMRSTNVMYSRQVIVFFVDRRTQTYTLNSSSFNVLRMPTSVAGFEVVNTADIDIEAELTLADRTEFILESIVCVDTKTDLDPNNPNARHVIGSSALFMVPDPTNHDGINIMEYSPQTIVKRTAHRINVNVFQTFELKDRFAKIRQDGVIFIYTNKDHTDTTTQLMF